MDDTGDTDVGRRAVLRTVAAGATVGVLATVASPASAQSTDLSEWFANTDNADSVTDRTGQESVTVRVGTDGNGAGFGFGPAAVRVDSGTTVTWEWTGQGGDHNVVGQDGSFESDLQGEGTFEHAFESAGVTRYVCTPHEAMGMKGAVVVGDTDVTLGSGSAAATATPGASEAGDTGEELGVSDAGVDYEGWFEDVGNFDGTVDATGRDEVRIDVGAEGNGGNLAFDPPAVHVDPGTTVVWEWTGQGGDHNVVGQDGSFESDLQGEAGATYGLDVGGNGVLQYTCTPHEAAGMKGAVVVGTPAGESTIDWFRTGLVGLAATIVAGPFVASEVLARRRRNEGERQRSNSVS